MGDLKLSGSQTISGGIYDNVSISGSVKIDGNLKCKNLKHSGSLKTIGDIESEEFINTSGTFSCNGQLKTPLLKCSGSVKVNNFDGGKLSSSGSFSANGNINATEINGSGTLNCANLQSDTVDINGRIIADNEINAESFHLHSAFFSTSKANSVVGSNIVIKPSHNSSLLSLSALMKASLIEGDNITLECVEADLVRGKDVVIGKKCKIKRLEYSGTAQICEKSEIGETIKL